MPLTKKDWTLLAVAAAMGDPLTPVQLQKSLFLLGEKRQAVVGQDFYQFEPYSYGPFCRAIYDDAEILEAEGFVRIDRADPGRNWAQYSATVKGLARARELRDEAPTAAVEYLDVAVQWVRSLSFSELVRAIYQEFPEQKKHSVLV